MMRLAIDLMHFIATVASVAIIAIFGFAGGIMGRATAQQYGVEVPLHTVEFGGYSLDLAGLVGGSVVGLVLATLAFGGLYLLIAIESNTRMTRQFMETQLRGLRP